MGSGQSTRVRSADVHSHKRSAPNVKISLEKENQVTAISSDEEECSPEKTKKALSLKQAKCQIVELQKQLKTMNSQMTELECQNLDLQDHIQTLEQQIEFNEKESAEKNEVNDYTETLNIKQQCIEKLEAEVEKLNSEMSKSRIKFKKKLRLMKTKYAESKNDGSLEVFEMREAVNRLKEENEHLTKNQKSRNEKQEKIVSQGEEDVDSGKMKIILDLSARVSEQDAKIIELENKLTEKVKLVNYLQSQNKSGSSVSQKVSTQEKLQSPKTKRGDDMGYVNELTYNKLSEKSGNDWYTNKTFEQLAQAATSSEITDSANNEDDDLKGIAEEIKRLQLSKKKGKGPKNRTLNHGARKNSSELEDGSRHSSGVSRDSGYSLQSESAFRGGKDGSFINHRTSSASSRVSLFSQDSAVTQDTDDTYTNKGETILEGGDIVSNDNYKDRNASSYLDADTSIFSESQRSTPIDPANIRQISALGAKTKRKKRDKAITKNIENNVVGLEKKPPVIRVASSGNKEMFDADMLIDSIDEDMLRFSQSGAPQTIAAVSS